MIVSLVAGINSILAGADPLVHAIFDPLHLPGVGDHWRTILASLLGHIALLYAYRPISLLLFPRTFKRLNAADQQGWCVALTAIVHTAFDAWFILKFINHPALNNDKMDGYNPEFEHYLAIALGYYVWDLSTCIYNYADYGIMYLIHGGLGVFGLLILISRQLQFYAIPYLLPELSSVFLNIRHLLKYAGLTKSLVYKVNFAIFFVTYVVIRIGFEAYHSAKLVGYVYHQNIGNVFYPYAVFFAILGITLTVLNTIWLRQIVNAAYYTLYPQGSKHKSKAN
ncbi:hypothetical protein IWW36_000513 [Coemansia brasiliensis]|uniref:TLC domain-containing protein n=1 Tax=Coemansia brasiliensis TaxID=2650707 RepID=A0A9W8M1Q5_9FUNG|nr:hypothetical protein IWW36_000513 [Coemansia brasiliensis]